MAQRNEVYQALATLAILVRGMNLCSVSVLLSALLAFFFSPVAVSEQSYVCSLACRSSKEICTVTFDASVGETVS